MNNDNLNLGRLRSASTPVHTPPHGSSITPTLASSSSSSSSQDEKARKNRDAFLKNKVNTSKLYQSQMLLEEVEEKLRYEATSKEQLLDAHFELLRQYQQLKTKFEEKEKEEKERHEEDKEKEKEKEEKEEEEEEEGKIPIDDNNVEDEFHIVTKDEVQDAQFIDELQKQLTQAKKQSEEYGKALRASERQVKILEDSASVATHQVDSLKDEVKRQKDLFREEMLKRSLNESEDESNISNHDASIQSLETRHKSAEQHLKWIKAELNFAKKTASEEMARVKRLESENILLKEKVEELIVKNNTTSNSKHHSHLHPHSHSQQHQHHEHHQHHQHQLHHPHLHQNQQEQEHEQQRHEGKHNNSKNLNLSTQTTGVVPPQSVTTPSHNPLLSPRHTMSTVSSLSRVYDDFPSTDVVSSLVAQEPIVENLASVPLTTRTSNSTINYNNDNRFKSSVNNRGTTITNQGYTTMTTTPLTFASPRAPIIVQKPVQTNNNNITYYNPQQQQYQQQQQQQQQQQRLTFAPQTPISATVSTQNLGYNSNSNNNQKIWYTPQQPQLQLQQPSALNRSISAVTYPYHQQQQQQQLYSSRSVIIDPNNSPRAVIPASTSNYTLKYYY